MKDNVEIPPGATVFKSAGKTYFLYMGALEMQELQREWGISRTKDDTPESWAQKKLEFEARIDGATMEDKLAALRHGLKRWARAAGNGEGPIEVDDTLLEQITDNLEQAKGGPNKAPFILVGELHQRFIFDCFGFGDPRPAGGAAGPKEKGRKASTPSVS